MTSRDTFKTRTTAVTALAAAILMLLSAMPQATGAPPAKPPRDTRPNFVVVFLDDMRKDDLVAMPFTRRLIGGKGATFENAYSPFPLCCPARATILTGQYSHNHRVLSNQLPTGGVTKLRARHTLGVWLKSAGYATAYIGKYLNGYGFETPQRYVPPGWTSWQGISRGQLHYRNFTVNANRKLRKYEGAYQTTVMGGRSVGFIRNHSGPKPFLLVSAFLAPHVGRPFEGRDPSGVFATPAPERGYRGAYESRAMPLSPAYDEADVSDKPGHISKLEPLSKEQIAAHQELYQQRLESIRSVDARIRDMVRTLGQTGELRNTYFLVTSDNGFLLGEHRVPFGKIHHYEPSARIPLLLRGPGIPQGRRVRQLAGLHDIAPTVLAAARSMGKQTRPLDGRNLIPLTRSATVSARRDLLLEAGPRKNEARGMRYRALRTNTGWKYVWNDSGEVELYNLRKDPDEMQNLAGDPRYDAKERRLAAGLSRLKACGGAACLRDAAR